MHEISDLMQGFNFFFLMQGFKAVFFHHIVIDDRTPNMAQMMEQRPHLAFPISRNCTAGFHDGFLCLLGFLGPFVDNTLSLTVVIMKWW